jgi:hypothetical protein
MIPTDLYQEFFMIRRPNMSGISKKTFLSNPNNSRAIPELIGRSAIKDFFPGILNGKTLANLASQGRGPHAYKIGRRVYYRYEDLMDWIKTNSQPILSIDAPL